MKLFTKTNDLHNKHPLRSLKKDDMSEIKSKPTKKNEDINNIIDKYDEMNTNRQLHGYTKSIDESKKSYGANIIKPGEHNRYSSFQDSNNLT